MLCLHPPLPQACPSHSIFPPSLSFLYLFSSLPHQPHVPQAVLLPRPATLWRNGSLLGLGVGALLGLLLALGAGGRLEALLEVGDDVVKVLDADGDADQVLGDARGDLLLVGELLVGGGPGAGFSPSVMLE